MLDSNERPDRAAAGGDSMIFGAEVRGSGTRNAHCCYSQRGFEIRCRPRMPVEVGDGPSWASMTSRCKRIRNPWCPVNRVGEGLREFGNLGSHSLTGHVRKHAWIALTVDRCTGLRAWPSSDGASARGEDAELVALWVGEAYPWHIALADIGISGAERP